MSFYSAFEKGWRECPIKISFKSPGIDSTSLNIFVPTHYLNYGLGQALTTIIPAPG